MKVTFFLSIGLCMSLLACEPAPEQATPEAEAVSLLGDSLYRPALSAKREAEMQANLEAARTQLAQRPEEEISHIWLGRRLAYLSHYREAITVYTQALEQFPQSYRLLRHRGHRYITLRQFDRAIRDLSEASIRAKDAPIEIEPDGIPNRLNRPLSNTHFNIWYHLGLAHYLKGEYAEAAQAYAQCMEVSDNDDLRCATLDWYYMTLQRLGQASMADSLLQRVHAEMEIIENDSYYKRLLLYQGKYSPDSLLLVAGPDSALSLATQGYGVGNYYLRQGDTAQAKQIFRSVLEGPSWAAFGYIAAEADLVRLGAGTSE